MNENTTTEKPTRVRLAHKAADIITGDRQADYGPPEVNFMRIARLWNDHMEVDIFTPRKVAELMLLLKIARTVNSPTEDSYVDLIGYAALAGEMAETEKRIGTAPVPYVELATKRDLDELKNLITEQQNVNIDVGTVEVDEEAIARIVQSTLDANKARF